MRKFRVLLDANVLVNARLRDVFLTAAELELVEVYWSDAILNETACALTEDLELPSPKVARLVSVLRDRFPDASISGYSHLIGTLELPDRGDRHVLAAATHGECDLLVTFNTRDFPAQTVEKVDLAVMTPDEAIVLLDSEVGDGLGDVIRTIAQRLTRPSRTIEDLIVAIGRDAPTASIFLGARVGLPDYDDVLEGLLASSGSPTAQAAAWRLVDAVLARDAQLLEKLVDPRFAERLTGRKKPKARSILRALTDALVDVVDPDEWGVGSAQRPHDVSVELVKFVRVSDGRRVMAGPTSLPGHLFYLRHDGVDWLLTGLDGPDPEGAKPQA